MVRFREEAGLSQADAALDSGIPVDNLRRYESGKVHFDVVVLKAMADVYGHALEDFFASDPPPAKLEDRPAIFARIRGGIEVDDDIWGDVVRAVDRANGLVAQRRRTRRPRLPADGKGKHHPDRSRE